MNLMMRRPPFLQANDSHGSANIPDAVAFVVVAIDPAHGYSSVADCASAEDRISSPMPERAGKTPQLREKSWGEAQRTEIWILFETTIITAYGSVHALIRCRTLRHHNGDSLLARSIPAAPDRSPRRCQYVGASDQE
jgi:hypothetical protein